MTTSSRHLPDPTLRVLDDEHHRRTRFGSEAFELDRLSGFHTLQLVAGDVEHLPLDPPVISERIAIHVTSLSVERIGDTSSKRYRSSVELGIRIEVEADLPEEDLEGRRARRKEPRRLLELLVEEIWRAERRRAAEQRRQLTLEIEEAAAIPRNGRRRLIVQE